MRKAKLLLFTLIAPLMMNAANPVKGVDRANLDPSTRPGQDFYQYACGGWMKAHPLDPQYARFGTFDQLRENSNEQVRELITNLGKQQHAQGTLEQKVADLFSMGMDSVTLNQQGGTALESDLARLSGTTRGTSTQMLAWLHAGIASPFFGSSVMPDLKNSDVNLMYLSQGGLGLGDRDYYLENDAPTKKIREAYTSYAQQLFRLVGYKAGNAKKMAANVLKIETALAQVAQTREESRDMTKQYNIYTLAQLQQQFPNIKWGEYFAALGAKQVDRICITQPKSIAKVNELMGSLKDAELRDYFMFKYIDAASPYLSDQFVLANFDMYSRALSGTQVQRPRWKRAIEAPNSLLGEAVGQLYVAKYFPAESKKKMQRLVDNLRVALGEHIQSLSWMGEKTKVNALVKLNSFTVKIGYPDSWRDYSAATVDRSKSYWQNIVGLLKFESEFHYGQCGEPVDKARWQMTPQTVNAYYDPTTNEICFPAAILQKPYFDPDADDAVNYGAIGVVIGHEMTHGFDDQGRSFDQNGNMIDWWTSEDASKFQALASKLGAQYSAEIVADDVHANGNFTMGENIADHGGLRVSYSAFKHTAQGQGSEKIDGFTPDQRFFLAYANVWANNITKEEILRRTKVDPHSIGRLRVNVAIRNLEPFFKAFDIKAGDAMWRDNADRVEIW